MNISKYFLAMALIAIFALFHTNLVLISFAGAELKIDRRDKSGFGLYDSTVKTSADMPLVADGSSGYNETSKAVSKQATNSRVINVLWFGALGDDGTTDNYSAFIDAVEALLPGDILYVPRESGYFSITNSMPIDIPVSDITFEIDGEIRAEMEGADLFNISGDRVRIVGPGAIRGPGTFIQDQSSSTALIRISGPDCRVENLAVYYPPVIGIKFNRTTGGSVERCLFAGGPSIKTGPFGFGVFIGSSTKINVRNNRFTRFPGDDDGKIISAVGLGPVAFYGDPDGESTSGSRDCLVYGNIADNLWEHAVYLTGYRNIVTNNIAKYTSKVAYIIAGSENIVTGNQAYSVNGGIGLQDSSDSIVDGNILIHTDYETNGAHAIGIEPLYTDSVISRNRITNNTIQGTYAGAIVFRVAASGNTATEMDDNIVAGNIISEVGHDGLTNQTVHGICFHGTSLMKNRTQILNNIISGVQGRAISVDGLVDSKIADNNATGINRGANYAWSRGIFLDDCTRVEVSDNIINQGVDGDLYFGVWEEEGSSQNIYRNNSVLDYFASPYYLSSTDASITTDKTVVQTLSGNYIFKKGEGHIYLIDPAGNISFNPYHSDGVYPAGYEIIIVNTGDAGGTITFDSYDLSHVVEQNQRGVFTYTGTQWRGVSM